MATQQDDARLAARLRGFFRDVLSQKREIRASRDAQHFIEALQAQQPPGACIESVIAGKSGLEAVRNSVRVDLSPPFLINHTMRLLQYLSDPGVKALADGQHLQLILLEIVRPPTVWNALLQLFRDGKIPDDALHPFAWLMLELVSLPPNVDVGVNVLVDIDAIVEGKELTNAASHKIREVGYQITEVLRIRRGAANQVDQIGGPGGRHDNDFADFRKIALYPTMDEFLSTRTPFYRRAEEVFQTDVGDRAGIHIDNQFRLLREDMLAELREDLHGAVGKPKGGKRKPSSIGQLSLLDIHIDDRHAKYALVVRCYQNLEFLKKLTQDERRKFLEKNPNILKHQAFGVLYRGEEICGFASVDRDIDLLTRSPPRVLLRFTDLNSFGRALTALKPGTMTSDPGTNVRFVLVKTAFFAYEPVLEGLKRITSLPLQDILLNPAVPGRYDFKPAPQLEVFASRLRSAKLDKDGRVNLAAAHDPGVAAQGQSKVRLDPTQRDAFVDAFTRPVSLIQGPPGTGKSFVGAGVVKSIHELTHQRILVITYTNHALNQFFEDVIKSGVPRESMVRLGFKYKCTPATSSLLLSEKKSAVGRARSSRDSWLIINKLRFDGKTAGDALERAFSNFRNHSASWEELSEFLSFSADHQHFYDALLVPIDTHPHLGESRPGGWRRMGRAGREVGADYLFERWRRGEDAGIFKGRVASAACLQGVWDLPPLSRRKHMESWMQAMTEELVEAVKEKAHQFSDVNERHQEESARGDVELVKGMRILGCTTTAVAKYGSLVRGFQPDVVVVEEAGEVLESHVLVALVSSVKQLVLIGDHKQLRPKINNYAFTVEKGEGFDLNRSLFERMILQGASHTTLLKQHRMAPEISEFPRRLTYPGLLDGPKTSGRPTIRGLRDRVVFINHAKPEDVDDGVADRRDSDSAAGIEPSKKNSFEAEMVLSIVKFLGQQGYSSQKMVILTPYLGQLCVIRDLLNDRSIHDPQLSDLDNFELIRAGLATQASASVDKVPLRLSTIDNYQGEESDIVIASLTRSNSSGDIGFMAAPERLNVLSTRARDCIIYIGNMATFMGSKKGRDTWHPFFEILRDNEHLYDGLPIRCERHNDRTALLQEPIDFDRWCPDGGCTELCGALLKCGIHKCQLRCHRVSDHSKVECQEKEVKLCERQHKTSVACSRRNEKCRECVAEDKELERRIKRDLKLEKTRLMRQAAYAKELQDLKDEIEHERNVIRLQAETEEHKKTLERERADLAMLKERNGRLQQAKAEQLRAEKAAAGKKNEDEGKGTTKNNPDSSDTSDITGTAKEDWIHQKQAEGAKSVVLDKLMDMIGLEEVKQAFLEIKAKVDTALRQGVSLASERFGCSLLGNPGTGKTTVARLYADFLSCFGVIPGTCFKEATGASLANGGVAGCKKILDEILNTGGGVFFIDEAYQLTSGNNPGGGACLDFLLAEVENQTGKIVFVLAGYDKQMESFFSHNPGLPSRFPIQMTFSDYTDDELLRILELKINKKYGHAPQRHMKCVDGLRGLYCRIVARRIGRGRGKEGFGNARAVENTLANICSRQATRLRRERRDGHKPDDMLFTKEDLIGPEPSKEGLARCEAWQKLQSLIGLQAVKESVRSLVDTLQHNYQRELAEQPSVEYSLNKVFLGNPGTGKTTVAKLYGQILVAMGMLSKGEVVVKNPSDFVGGALGQSEQQTKGILAATLGKVLVIDEAYGLYDRAGQDPYKSAVIDTIVAEVQSVPGDDRCVLMLGYTDQMEDMFQNVNPGLSRRFPISSAFNFEDFSDDELREILDLKLKLQGFRATDQAKQVALEMLGRARNRPNFGNAGEIDILLNDAKAKWQKRLSKGQQKFDAPLEPQDFDPDFDRVEKADTTVAKLFEGTVGCEAIVELLGGYQDTVRTMKAIGMDPKENIPFNFIFRGPPGTGKTSTAKKMGQFYYDLGFLATAQVEECSATDMIGQYVGQTGPKVQQLLDKALGRVLFVDEAYRLAEGGFAKEAMDELVDCITKTKYHKKLIIILAGYEKNMNRLMDVNPGLTSRFPGTVDFRPFTPQECIALLTQLLSRSSLKMMASKSKGKSLDLTVLESPSDGLRQSMLRLFSALIAGENWANARDVQTLERAIFNKALRSQDAQLTGRFVVSGSLIEEELEAMLQERQNRSRAAASFSFDSTSQRLQTLLAEPAPPRDSMKTTATTTTTTTCATAAAKVQAEQTAAEKLASIVGEEKDEQSSKEQVPPHEGSRRAYPGRRDAGVSDEVWEQLQRDWQAEQDREDEYQRLVEARKRASGAERDKIVKRLIEEERRRKEEEKRREILRMAGQCPIGFPWIKQDKGYRCAGGSHYITDGELEKFSAGGS